MKRLNFYIHVLILITIALNSCKKEEIILQVPEVTTFLVGEITYQSAICGGSVNSIGSEIISRGICWSTNPEPTISDSISTDGNENGSFTIILDNLKPDSIYYIRAFATNNIGTGYGSIIKFKTKQASIKVITSQICDISYQTATCGGSVTTEGATVTKCGICWSTDPYPTLADSSTVDSNEAGSFTSTMIDLKSDITYYVRAYALNAEDTIYGSTMKFKTKRASFSITTKQPKMILYNFMSGGGVVSSVYGAEIIRFGVCWSLSPYPTIDDYVVYSSSYNLDFTAILPKLPSNKHYYIRAFAATYNELIYGNNITFSTRPIDLAVSAPLISAYPTTFNCTATVTSPQSSVVTARGFCWSSSRLPTIDDNIITVESESATFSGIIERQSGVSTYFIRSYATDSEGTVYGDVLPNISGVPIVQSISIEKTGTNNPVLKGQIISHGNSPTTMYGICLSRLTNPTIENSTEHDSEQYSTDKFSFSLNTLLAGKTYFVRSYAKNSYGIAYSNVIVYVN